MKKFSWRWILVGSLAGALLLGALGTALAITMFQETLAGLGSAAFTDEVGIEKIKVKGLDEVRVRLFPTLNTVADRVYSVELYGDDDLLGTEIISWTAMEASTGTRKDVTFLGLSLGSITELDVDVVY